MTLALVEKLRALDIDLVVLAGCMVIFTEELVQAYPNAIMNVHPALIPSFCGQGFYGLHVHEAALAYGVKLSGATVHFVSAESRRRPHYRRRRPSPFSPETPPRRFKNALWSRPNGSCCRKPCACSVRAGSGWKAAPLSSNRSEKCYECLRNKVHGRAPQRQHLPRPGHCAWGQTPDGKTAVAAYFIMGRSVNSRNRVFVQEPDGIRTEAFDPSLMKDPHLIIYHPVREAGQGLIVTNGDQTDTVWEYLAKGESWEAALRTRQFEDDAPNWTPRISGLPGGGRQL